MTRLPTVGILILLGLMIAGGAAMLLFAPVTHYTIECSHTPAAQCTLVRGRLLDVVRGGPVIVVVPGFDAAVVDIVPVRRGSPRVLLYLQTRGQRRFAAEFEGADAGDAAYAAARTLDDFVAHPAQQTVRVDAHAPPFLGILSGITLAIAALLLVTVSVRMAREPAERG